MPLTHQKQKLNYLFLLPVAIAVILVIATLHYVGYQQHKLNMHVQAQHLTESHLEMLNAVGSEYIVNFESELLNNLHQSFLEHDDVHALVIENHLTNERLGNINLQTLPRHYEQNSLSIFLDDKRIGLINIIFNRQELHLSLRRAAQLLTASFLLSATIIILSLLLLYRTQILAQLESRHKQEEDIRRQHRFLENLLESTNNLMLVMSHEGIIQHVNQACITALGKSKNELLNHSIEEFFYPISRVNSWKHLLNIDNYNDKYEPFICAPIDKDSPIIEWVFTFSSTGSERLITGSGTNIEFEEDVQHKLYLAERIFEECSDALVITDHNEIITDVNDAFEKNMGYSREEVLGKTPCIFKSSRHNSTFYTAMWKDIVDKGCWTGELWNQRKSGEIYPMLASISTIKKHDGKVTHYLAIYHDITEKKKHEKQLEKLAHNDPLTELPNRRYLQRHIEKSVLQAERDNSKMAILYIDLDGFKKVNDKISHQAGDMVLKNLAVKFQNLIRTNEFIARLGGDEFCMVISRFTNNSQLECTARRLIDECSETILIEGMNIEIGMSIGIAIYPDNGKTYQELTSKADAAMYFVKNDAKGSYAFAT